MGKVVILETTDILGMKMRKILMNYGFNEIEIIKGYGFNIKNTNSMFVGADFIIADLDNYDLDSVKLVKNLKSSGDNSEIPAIFMSGSADLNKLKKVIAAGGTDFLLKPFEVETLIKKIRKICYKQEVEPVTQEKYPKGAIFDEETMTLKWLEEFELGVEEIDNDHKRIIENYNKLCMVIKNNEESEFYKELIEFLSDYVSSHFVKEEKLQFEIKYNKYNEHKKIHEDFKNKVKHISEKYKDKKIEMDDLISINLFLKDWLLEHILVEDQKIKEFILSATK